ncbi:MAG: dipeptidase PepV [Bacilli bacterium]
MNIHWTEQVGLIRDKFIDDLQSFLSINSIEDMTTASEGKPFGLGVADALAFMLDGANRDGFKTKNLEGYAGYIELGEGEEQIGVLAHVDVVPTGDGWTTPPFQPNIREGRIYARGAIDDKGPALAAYYALKIVRDSKLPLSKKVRLIIGTDEESGWLCMKRYAELEQLPEIGFSPDADFPIIHAEKGQINPVLVLAEKNEEDSPSDWVLQSFQAGDRVNMVPDQANAVVSLTDTGDEVSTFTEIEHSFNQFLKSNNIDGKLERGDNTLSFNVEGKAAHGMEPFEGINAGLLLASFLKSYTFQASAQSFLRLLTDVLHDDFYGVNIGMACEDEVTGKLTVNAGVLQYDLDRKATVKLNIRYPATVTPEQLTPNLTDILATIGWVIKDIRTSKAHHVPKDHPSIQTLQRVYEEQTGQEAALLFTGGATYARSMKYGVAFGAVFPGKEMTAHKKDEYAEIDDLIKAISIYAQAIYELAK